MPDRVPNFRVFISSPGDVADERAIARNVIEQLPYDPLLRGLVTFEVVAWDKPGGDTPLRATMTPQEAINKGLPKPSECDIVVVIFWARMGTPLPEEYKKPDGSPYLSGTEWEYEDGMQAARKFQRPEVVIYRRIEEPVIGMKDSQRKEKIEQWERVEGFFAKFVDPETGAILHGYNQYNTPDQFREKFQTHVRVLVKEALEKLTSPSTSGEAAAPIQPVGPPRWEGSPFPGLRAFTPDDAAIFLGRGRETDALLKKLSDSRFVAVVGASGSGKSSLVGAGLIPRLQEDAIAGSKDWLLPQMHGEADNRRWERLRFPPGGEVGDNSFAALALALQPVIDRPAREVAETLQKDLSSFDTLIAQALNSKPEWAEVLLFIDQFEELFTLAHPDYRERFSRLLTHITQLERVRVVVTLRADFYHRCVEIPQLADLLREGTFPLAAPTSGALYEMITRPAERAGLTFEEGLPARIVEDTGSEPGSLALLAYTLDELYRLTEEAGDNRLTHKAYQSLDGVQGAIGTRARTVFESLDSSVQAALPVVFQELVDVDERGVATRQRAPLSRFTGNGAAITLIDRLTTTRLLTQSWGENRQPVVEVAHEALLRRWSYLAEWIEAKQDDLRLLRDVRLAALTWERSSRNPDFLWTYGRLETVYAMIQRLQPQLDSATRDFVAAELERMVNELSYPQTPEERRFFIGERLAGLGDTRSGVALRQDGLPDIVWCEVSADGRSFWIAKYLVTYIQYRVFLDATDGYANPTWWEGLRTRQAKPGWQNSRVDNHPADNVSWYDAVAYCRWLSTKLGYEIRLPSAKEHDLAARITPAADLSPPQPPEPVRAKDFSRFWEPTKGSEHDRPERKQEGQTDRRELVGEASIAVGLYPSYASDAGVLDIDKLVFEWTVDDGLPDTAKQDHAPIMRAGYIGFRIATAEAQT